MLLYKAMILGIWGSHATVGDALCRNDTVYVCCLARINTALYSDNSVVYLGQPARVSAALYSDDTVYMGQPGQCWCYSM